MQFWSPHLKKRYRESREDQEKWSGNRVTAIPGETEKIRTVQFGKEKDE